MINFINDNYDRHIITLEDPIEYFHKHKKCTVNQREIGVDVPDFQEGIRRALRMDPDIILVGEMRDLATIHAAIEAAETGHIVFGTLHTSGAAAHRQPDHRRVPQGPAGPDPHAALDGAHRRAVAGAAAARSRRALVAAYEMMVVTPAIPNLIRENKTYRIDSSSRPAASTACSCSTTACSTSGRTGWCEKEEVLLKSSKPAELAAKIAHAERGIWTRTRTSDEDEDEDEDEDDDDDDDDRAPRRRDVDVRGRSSRSRSRSNGRMSVLPTPNDPSRHEPWPTPTDAERPEEAESAGKPAAEAGAARPPRRSRRRPPATRSKPAPPPAKPAAGRRSPAAARQQAGAPAGEARPRSEPRPKPAAASRAGKPAAEEAGRQEAGADVDGSRQLGQILVDLGLHRRGPALEIARGGQAATDAADSARSPSSRGLINEDQLLQALAEQHGMQVVNLEEVKPTPEAVKLVPENDGRASTRWCRSRTRTTC